MYGGKIVETGRSGSKGPKMQQQKNMSTGTNERIKIFCDTLPLMSQNHGEMMLNYGKITMGEIAQDLWENYAKLWGIQAK